MTFKELGEKIEGFNDYPLWGKILSKVFIDLCEIIGMILAILYVPVLWIMYGINKYRIKNEKREIEKLLKEFIKEVDNDIEYFVNCSNKDMSQHDKNLTMEQLESSVKHRAELIDELNKL